MGLSQFKHYFSDKLASVEQILIISFHEDKAEDAKEEKVVQKVIEPQPEPPPIKRWFIFLFLMLNQRCLRYYGRKKAEESDSELSVDSESSEEQARFVPTTPIQSQIFIRIFSVLFGPEMVKVPVKDQPIRKSVRFYFNLVQSSLVECSGLSDPRNVAFHY